jgi:hypothetical protein
MHRSSTNEYHTVRLFDGSFSELRIHSRNYPLAFEPVILVVASRREAFDNRTARKSRSPGDR